jgi:hypothetical protein
MPSMIIPNARGKNISVNRFDSIPFFSVIIYKIRLVGTCTVPQI